MGDSSESTTKVPTSSTSTGSAKKTQLSVDAIEFVPSSKPVQSQLPQEFVPSQPYGQPYYGQPTFGYPPYPRPVYVSQQPNYHRSAQPFYYPTMHPPVPQTAVPVSTVEPITANTIAKSEPEVVVAEKNDTEKPVEVPSVPTPAAPEPATVVEKKTTPKPEESQWKRDCAAQPAEKKESKSEGGWERGGHVKQEDSRFRFDKLAMFACLTLNKYTMPENIKAMYEKYGTHERIPCGYESSKRMARGLAAKEGVNPDVAPTAEELAKFNENMKTGFHYDPTRLTASEDPTVILNKANLTLNKLSVEKFDKLSDDFLSLGLHTEEFMDKIVDMIVKKAQLQATFGFMYANLCKKITDTWSSLPLSSDDGADEEVKDNSYGKLFKTKLLGRCQDEFDVDRVAALEKIRNDPTLDAEDKLEKEIIAKSKFNGHMIFIGEIYAVDLVKPASVFACLNELLQTPDEDSLVCLVRLFETLGKKLEEYCSKKKKNLAQFTEIFDKVHALLADKNINTRMTCLLKDLIDLRANKWEPRIKVQKATKISVIHEQAQKEMQGSTRPHSAAPPGKGMVHSTSQDFRKAGNKSPQPAGNSEWTTIPTKGGKPVGKGMPRSSSLNSMNEKSSKSSFGSFGKFSSLEENSPKKGKGKFDKKEKHPPQSGFGALSLDTNEKEDDEESSCFTPALCTSIPDNKVNKFKGSLNEFLTLDDVEVDTLVCEVGDLVRGGYAPAAIKLFLNVVMDGKDSDRLKVCDFFAALMKGNAISTNQFISGLFMFLNDFDDLLLDTPNLLGYMANIMARVIATHKLISITALKDLPDDNMFKTSTAFHALFAEILRIATTLDTCGLDCAKELYKELDMDFSEYLLLAPNEDKTEALNRFLEKHHIKEVVA